MTTVPLRTDLGERLDPQTLVTVLVVSPEGSVRVDPGALHGRSELESGLRFVTQREQLHQAERHWFVWAAVELEASSGALLRYKGLAVSEVWVDRAGKAGYKVLAEHVNRMSEAWRGMVNLKTLDAGAKGVIREQLVALGPELWQRSAPALQEALA